MSLFADLLTTIFERRMGAAPRLRRDPRPLPTLVSDLLEARSEGVVTALARQVLQRYDGMSGPEKLEAFRGLAALNIDAADLRSALDAYEAAPSGRSYRAFMAAAEPPRAELLRRLNMVPGATERLVRMRSDLLRRSRDEPELQALDEDFRHLFKSWFNRGFLVLRPISWESPAHVLEKIIAYEAVHAIHSWDDLRRRLAPPDRRCFAFFHPAMPDEPLIFVEVALTRGVPGSVQALLSEDREPMEAASADTAVFYSISNCQPGLAGISFGNSLIKQVASDLSSALPGLKTFVTLSPIPGLVAWLEEQGTAFDPQDVKRMSQLAAHYLLTAKRGDGRPRDPVARFHLGNGAMVHAVHAGADTSENGQRQSGGAMVNYLYDLPKVETYHDRFAATGEVIASSAVKSLSAGREKAQA
ncbi:malonyl-CoA decarboxylase [Salipiger sp. PrR002]|uniref:malonyl-CoA decarboxylase n=1 Tax=Salipiger sp. PrR002 TaxID=2706489 RepID=UPI0013BDC6BB|nr:malonyl-CoA decarboxylase [Salipiger sp. PrR002]NDV97711.1 malonyl-CoA decarboxylase [Salipiger sp. PrR002]NDW55202.1 malonyl-CoA decarboxylase [Salipiger sp. PrR004]